MTTVAETLAGLFTGAETWAYWAWRFPCIRARLGAVSPAVADFAWNDPKLDLTRDTDTVRQMLELLQKLYPANWKLQGVWMEHWLGKSQPPQQAKDEKAGKEVVALLGSLEWPSHFELHDWPRYRDKIRAATSWPDATIEKLWDRYQIAERARFKASHSALSMVDDEAGAGLVGFGDPAQLYARAFESTTRASFDLVLEEAHLAGAYEVLPLLYELAWKLKTNTKFPGMPSGWSAAVAKAQAFSTDPSENDIESWLVDIARAVAKERVAPLPMFDLKQPRPIYRVRYVRYWWDGDGWPKGWPSSKVQVGDGPADGYDVRKVLLQQNLDELKPELNDIAFALAFGTVSALIAGGIAKILFGQLGAALPNSELLTSTLESGAKGAIQQGIGNATGQSSGDVGDAFLAGASSGLKENMELTLDGFTSQLTGGLNKFGDLLEAAGSVKQGLDNLGKGKPVPLKELAPSAPTPIQPAPPGAGTGAQMPAKEGLPTWGKWALAIGGALAGGILLARAIR